jgi:hypothetical protein
MMIYEITCRGAAFCELMLMKMRPTPKLRNTSVNQCKHRVLLFLFLTFFATPSHAEMDPKNEGRPYPCTNAYAYQNTNAGTNTELNLETGSFTTSHTNVRPKSTTASLPDSGEPNALIPAPLMKPKDIIPLGCERPFTYRNEIYSVDSPQAQDGSTLRYFLRDEKEPSEILAQYERNRIKSKFSGYTGTLGLLAIIAARFIKTDQTRGIVQLAGVTLAAGGFIYSFTLLRSNESLIPKAVDAHNQTKPNDPIELQFSTGWSF